jgi:hypothetical protein
MTNSQHAALIRTLLSMQRRCDTLAARLNDAYDGDPETDPGTAIHCVSASLEMAMQAVDHALENA